MGVPNLFQNQQGPIPLSQLDDNFAYLASNSGGVSGASGIGNIRSFTGAIGTNLHDWIEAQPINLIGDLSANSSGAIDVTAKIQAAINGGYDIYLGHGTFLVSAALIIPTTSARPVTIRGAGMGNTAILRATAYTAGDIFFADSIANPFSGWLTIENLSIINGNGALNTSGYALHIKNRACVNLKNILIYDGFGGVWLDGGVSDVVMDHVFYIQSSTYATTYGLSEAGYKQQGSSSAIQMTNCMFVGQNVTTANCLSYGGFFGGGDGFQATNCVFSGNQGIRFNGGMGFAIDDLYFDNIIIDSVRTEGIVFAGNNGALHVYTNIRFVGSHINPRITSGLNTVGVDITGDVDNVQFIGGNINLAGGTGVSVTNINNWSGNPRQSIKFVGVDITGNNLNNVGSANVTLDVGVTGISFTDCDLFNRTGSAGLATYAIALQGTNSFIKLIGCSLAPNVTGPIFFGNSTYTDIVMMGCLGLSDVVRSIASSATINLLTSLAGDQVSITGTNAVTTITGGWTGRVVYATIVNGFSFTAGVNIKTTVAKAAGSMAVLTYDGTFWWVL